MLSGKKSSLLQWEKVLGVMLTGTAINKDILEAMPEMKDVPMYRLSSYIYDIKLAGAVIKVTKNGRNIDKYVLVNIDEMQKYFEKRQKVFSAKSAASKPKQKVAKVSKNIEKLSDLDDLKEVVQPVVQDATVSEMEIVEITQ